MKRQWFLLRVETPEGISEQELGASIGPFPVHTNYFEIKEFPAADSAHYDALVELADLPPDKREGMAGE